MARDASCRIRSRVPPFELRNGVIAEKPVCPKSLRGGRYGAGGYSRLPQLNQSKSLDLGVPDGCTEALRNLMFDCPSHG